MAKAFISIGNKTDIGVSENNHLIIAQTIPTHEGIGGYHWETKEIDLGPLTDERVEEIKGYLDRLRVFV